MVPLSLALADATGDGQLDAIVVDSNNDGLIILPGRGDGSFGAPTAQRVRAQPFGVAAGDFNRDGLVDFALVHTESGSGTVGVVLARCIR